MLEGRRIWETTFARLLSIIGLKQAIEEAPGYTKRYAAQDYRFRQFLFGEESPGLGADLMADIVGAMEAKLRAMNLEFDAILAPEPGGLMWGGLIAHLTKKSMLFARIVAPDDAADAITNKYSKKHLAISVKGSGERVLIVDDLVSTGNTLVRLCALAKAAGFEVAGALLIYAREGDEESLSKLAEVPVAVCSSGIDSTRVVTR